MLTSKPSSFENDDCNQTNDQQTTSMPPNNNKLVSTIAKTEPLTTAITDTTIADDYTDIASNTAIAQHRNSGPRDSNGGKAVDIYIRASKSSSGHSNGEGNGAGGGGDHGSDDVGEETDVIGDLVGHFGKWQFLMTILLSLFQVPNTFHISSSVYQVSLNIYNL